MTNSSAQQSNGIPPPPRKIRGGFGLGVWVGRIFVAPFMIGFLVVTYFMILAFIWAACYTEVPGAVTGGSASRDSKGNMTYSLTYDYDVANRHYHGNQGVNADVYQKLKVEGAGGLEMVTRPVTIRHFGKGHIHFSNIKEAESITAAVFQMTFVFLIFGTIVMVFTWLVWIAPLRVRWLFIHGVTAPAAVIEKTSRRNKNSTTYYASIAYEHPLTHDRLERKVTVYKKKDWDSLETGQIVTALCHPQKSKRVAVPAWGPYRIVS